jgi:hypothetical protein
MNIGAVVQKKNNYELYNARVIFFGCLDELVPQIKNRLLAYVAPLYIDPNREVARFLKEGYEKNLNDIELSQFCAEKYNQMTERQIQFNIALKEWADKYNLSKQYWIIEAAEDLAARWAEYPDYRFGLEWNPDQFMGFDKNVKGPDISGWNPAHESEQFFDKRIEDYKRQVKETAFNLGCTKPSKFQKPILWNDPKIKIMTLILKEIVLNGNQKELKNEEIIEIISNHVDLTEWRKNSKDDQRSYLNKKIKEARELIGWIE